MHLFTAARFAQNTSIIATAAVNITIWIATGSSFQPCAQTHRCHEALIRRVPARAPEA